MYIDKVPLDENEIQLLMNDPEIRSGDSLQGLVLKIFYKVSKPLHIRELEHLIVNIGYLQAHNKEIPLVPSRSLAPILRKEKGIWKISDNLYGLLEWRNAADNAPKEETDVTLQAILQDTNIMNNSMEESHIIKKNCPECDGEIDIKRHFCKYCGADLYKFCSDCLSKLDEDSIFCADCGVKLEQRT